jgi:hypothetical protein
MEEVADERGGQVLVARARELQPLDHSHRLWDGDDEAIAVTSRDDGDRALWGESACVFGDECRAEGFAQRFDDPEAGRWCAARRCEHLLGEETELRVVVVAVGGFGTDADGPVIADGDFQIGGVQFPVVGER